MLVDRLPRVLAVDRDRRRLQLSNQLLAGREDVEPRRTVERLGNLRPARRNPPGLDVQQFEQADVAGLPVVVCPNQGDAALAVMDLVMPRLDGVEAMRELHERAAERLDAFLAGSAARSEALL